MRTPCADATHEIAQYKQRILARRLRQSGNGEVLPHAPDAWIDEEKTKVGYEIPFHRHFYEPCPSGRVTKEAVSFNAGSASLLVS